MVNWTVAIVNYHSAIYVKWQLKILYEFNLEKDFQVVIVDNSNDKKEFGRLSKISEDYNNIIIIKNYVKKSEGSSMQHGKGIDIALALAKINQSSFFLTIDPDCFILRKNFLNFLENKFSEGNIFIGTQYSIDKQKKIGANSDFPCAFACAYNISNIGYDVSFLPSSNDPSYIDKNGKDVGYKIRDQFNKLKYISFPVGFDNSIKFASSKLFKKKFEYFFFNKTLFAIHFNKTSRSINKKVNTYNPYKYLLNVYWNFLRERNSKICYQYIKNKS